LRVGHHVPPAVHHGHGGAGEGVLNVRRFVGDDKGLMTFGAGFEHATLLLWTGCFRTDFFDVFAG